MATPDKFYSVWLQEFVSYAAMIPLCFVAAAVFAFGSLIFYRISKRDNNTSAVLAGFLVLAVTECLCCLSGGLCLIFKLSLLELVRPPHNDSALINNTLHSNDHHAYPLPLMVTFYSTNYFLFVRNYCIVVKTALTTAHVFSPMRARAGLTSFRVRLAYLSCYLLAVAPVLARFSAEAFSMYVDPDELPSYAVSLSQNHDIVHSVIFALQGPLPAGLSVLMSMAISVKLLRRGSSVPENSSSRADLSTRAVVRTLLVAFVFAQCEIPTTVLALLDSREETQSIVLSRVVGNLLIILDSYCNLVIIVLSNRRFLHAAARMLGIRRADSHSAPIGGFGGCGATAGDGVGCGRASNRNSNCHNHTTNICIAEAIPLTSRSTILVRV